MNKKGIILLAVLMMAGGAVFASGQQDVDDSDNDVRGRGYNSEERFDGRNNDRFEGRYDRRADEDCDLCEEEHEEVSMTGTVEFTSSGTKMIVDGEEWNLMYPYRAVNIEIEDGTEITVIGWEVVIPEGAEDWMRGRMDFDEDEKLFHVVSAEIDGETYELDFDGPMGRGGRAGGFDRGGRTGGKSGGGRPMVRDRRG